MRKLLLIGAALVVLGAGVTVVGQLGLLAEMDAADAAGTAGTLFGPTGLAAFAGIVLLVAGAALLVVGAARALTQR